MTIDRQQLSKETLVLILAGGRGSRLHELTNRRSKPALYFGGSRRIIDFALSNCINSGLLRIGVVTQYAAHSLLRHLQHGWSFLPRERGEFIEMLPARQQIDDNTWYRGTADAVYQNIAIMTEDYKPRYVVILAGDHIYKQDYVKMIEDHIATGAKCTVSCIEVPKEDAKGFGVMEVDEHYRVTAFVEKPENPPTIQGKPDSSLASMGIYVFNAEYLYDILQKEAKLNETSHDFGKDILPKVLEQQELFAHPFGRSCMASNPNGHQYWKDVGTLESFWQAHLDLVGKSPKLDLYDSKWPIRGIPCQAFPTKFFSTNTALNPAYNSLIAGGCMIKDAQIQYSVLFEGVKIDQGSHIENAVILPRVTIGKNCKIKDVIIDKEVVIADNSVIGYDKEQDAKKYRISSTGKVVLVTQTMMEK